MCGRYAFYLDPSKLKSFFGLENLLNLPPRYNCAPMQDLPVIVKNRMGYARWGFRPEWSKQDDPAMASKMINARSETVQDKPSFRDAWARGKRCLVPANGFYEWQKDEETGGKNPYFIHHGSNDILCMAGLWSKVDDQVTFTVLTKTADGDIADLHHRMPVMFEIDQAPDWFEADLDSARAMIAQASGTHCKAYKVCRDVGKVSNDSEALIQRISA